MGCGEELIIHHAEHLAEPVIKARKDTEHSTHRQNIVEVSHNIICIMEIGIYTCIGEHHTCDTPNNEEEDKGQRPLHWNGEANRPAPHRCQP